MNVLIVSRDAVMRSVILDALKLSFAPQLCALTVVNKWSEVAAIGKEINFALVIIDIDADQDYLQIVHEVNIACACYITVVTRLPHRGEMVHQLNQTGAAKVLVCPIVDDLVVEFSDFKTKVWESCL